MYNVAGVAALGSVYWQIARKRSFSQRAQRSRNGRKGYL